MRNYQIAQETDAQNGVTAEGCVKGLLQCSTPSQTGLLDNFCNQGIALKKPSKVSECYADVSPIDVQGALRGRTA